MTEPRTGYGHVMKLAAKLSSRIPAWAMLLAITLLLVACPGDGSGGRAPY